MRKSLLALILVGSLLVVAVTTVLAGNPAADSIPDVGDIDVLASADEAAVPNADTNAAVLTEGAPPPAAADGLAKAEAAGDPLAAVPPSPADDGLATADLATTDGGISVPPSAATDGLAMAQAAAEGVLGDGPVVGSISVPAADAGDSALEAGPPVEAESGLLVAVTSTSTLPGATP